jgi:hypothetical protein
MARLHPAAQHEFARQLQVLALVALACCQAPSGRAPTRGPIRTAPLGQRVCEPHDPLRRRLRPPARSGPVRGTELAGGRTGSQGVLTGYSQGRELAGGSSARCVAARWLQHGATCSLAADGG